MCVCVCVLGGGGGGGELHVPFSPGPRVMSSDVKVAIQKSIIVTMYVRIIDTP